MIEMRSPRPAASPLVALLGAGGGRLRACVFRRRERIRQALDGRSDLDVLVHPADRAAFEARAAELGGKPCVLHPFHDNRSPGRADWLFLVPDRNLLLHLDVHGAIAAGPRFRKTLDWLGYDDAGPVEPCPTPAGDIAVAPRSFELKVALARAAFRPRARLPVGAAILALPPTAVAGIDGGAGPGVPLRLAPVAEGVSVPWRDLGRLRRHIRRQNGVGPVRAFGADLSSLCRGALYRATRGAEALGLRVWPGRRLATGGMIVALVGPDGMGKSTQAEELRLRLARGLSVVSLYLGSSGLVTAMVAGLRLRRARRGGGVAQGRAKAASAAGAPDAASPMRRLEDTGRAFWGLYLALYRRHTLRRARRLAARGYIVICDRWPQGLERGLLDGPVRRVTGRAGRFTERLFALEERLYAGFGACRPDLCFHLVAPFETAEARKPGELTRADFARRERLMCALRQADPSIRMLDAAAPADEVLGALLGAIWERA